MDAWDRAGDLIVGYQLHATHDGKVRPWHLARDGVVYYKEPKAGQKGLDKMPRPPHEPADPAERPPRLSSTRLDHRSAERR